MEDVRRVGEEVRPEVRRARGLYASSSTYSLELPARVLPREVRVGLAEADLGQRPHHRARRVNASARKITSGCVARTSAISHSQNGSGLVCGLSTRKTVHAALDPVQDDVEQRLPQPAPVLGVPVDVVDVLVLLGRVLGVLQRAVGAAVEPLGVLGEPRVVGRALDGEVERDVDAVLARGRDQRVEVLDRAEVGVERVVAAALVVADRPRASRGRPGRRSSALLRPLRFVLADRVDRRQVEDVEAELGELRAAARCTPAKPPHERGKSSYQAPKRARSRSTSSSSGRSSVGGVAAVGVALDGGEQLGVERGVVLAASRRRVASVERVSMTRSVVALGARGGLLEQQPRPRTARRRGRPGRRRPCARARRARRRTGRPTPRSSTAQRPSRSTGNVPAQRSPSTCGVDAAQRRSLPRRASPGAGSGRPRAGPRGRRGRRRRGDVDVVADAALGAGSGRSRSTGRGFSIWMRGRRLLRRAGTGPCNVSVIAPRSVTSLGVKLQRSQRACSCTRPRCPAAGWATTRTRFVDWLADGRAVVVADAAARPARPHGSPYKSPSAFAAWPGLLADPDAPVDADEERGVPRAPRVLDRRLGARSPARGAVADQVRFEREWARAARLRAPSAACGSSATCRSTSRPGGADHRAQPELFRDGVVAGVPPDAYTDDGPAVGQPALRLAGAAAPRLPLVDRAPAAHVRALRPRAHRPLPRLRRLLGGARGRARRARGPLAARPGPRGVRRVRRELGELPLIAEDLGVITPRGHAAARRARAARGWSSCSSASTPTTRTGRTASRTTTSDAVAYTGTHDTDTLAGWWASATERERAAARRGDARATTTRTGR